MSGKQTLLLISVLIVLATIIVGYFGPEGLAGVSSIWKIPKLYDVFSDLRVFTAASESLRAGYDPLYNNYFDPFGTN